MLFRSDKNYRKYQVSSRLLCCFFNTHADVLIRDLRATSRHHSRGMIEYRGIRNTYIMFHHRSFDAKQITRAASSNFRPERTHNISPSLPGFIYNLISMSRKVLLQKFGVRKMALHLCTLRSETRLSILNKG